MRERRKEGRERFSLRFVTIGGSVHVGPRTKVVILDESYAWILKSQVFAKDLDEEFGKSKASGLGSVYGTSLGCLSCYKRYGTRFD